MTGVLAVFVLLYAGLLGCWALASALHGGRLGVGYLGGLVLLELTLLVRAGIELSGLVAASAGPGGTFGRGYAEPAVHAGYLLASIVLLPLVLTVSAPARTRAKPGADTRPAPGQATDNPPARRGQGTTSRPAPGQGTDNPPARRGQGTDNPPARRQATWDALLAAVGCAAIVVVTLRMASTGRPG